MPVDHQSAGFNARVAEIRKRQGESIAIGDVAEVVQDLMISMAGDLSAMEIHIHKEIRELVDYIHTARQEIARINPGEIREVDIPVATAELEAVVVATEAATNTILDAAEVLGDIAEEIPAEQADRLAQVVTRIYEASNFQDITGQRISKVVGALRHIEQKVVMLAQALGQDAGQAVALPAPSDPDDEASLLNGPSMPGEANSQDDIDALLASFD